MPHAIDKNTADRKAAANIIRAHKWQKELNDRLERDGHKREGMFNKAINEAKKLHLIGDNTARMANDIRIRGNEAKHKYV